MSKEIKLAAKTRDQNQNVKPLRTKGFLPANLYGPGFKNQNLTIKRLDFERAFTKAGESTLIDLAINDSEPVKVVIKDAQKNPVKGDFIHVDLYQVDMNKKINTEITLEFTGTPKAVKELGGILVKKTDHIEAECLPGDLVEKIDVDLSPLNTYDDSIKIKDINLPSGVKFMGQPDEMVVSVIKPKEEKEEEPVSAEGEEEKKEGEEEKKEGEEEKKDGEEKPEEKK